VSARRTRTPTRHFLAGAGALPFAPAPPLLAAGCRARIFSPIVIGRRFVAGAGTCSSPRATAFANGKSPPCRMITFVIAFLASPAAGYVSGVNVPVDGVTYVSRRVYLDGGKWTRQPHGRDWDVAFTLCVFPTA